jgi:ribosome biogenesis GTPase / thiamine phosphate phosphatase
MLRSYGWSDALQREFDSLERNELIPARVVVHQRWLYRLASDAGELAASLSGRFMHDAPTEDFPAVGDWVAAAARLAEAAATIHHVLPRSSSFIRRAVGPGGGAQVVAANVDVAIIVSSLNEELNLRRLERYLATAWASGAQPVIALTKADLSAQVEKNQSIVEEIAYGVPVLAISALTGSGLDALAAHLQPGRTAVLIGSSGVGKSTLVNALLGSAHMRTQTISQSEARGRHTTTHRELVLMPSGALILDTPGMRELGLWDVSEGLSNTFEDIETLARTCRFRDCRHTSEPGCAVRAALESGTLTYGRWQGYVKLNRELAWLDRKEDPAARAAQRKIWVRRTKNNRQREKDRWRE